MNSRFALIRANFVASPTMSDEAKRILSEASNRYDAHVGLLVGPTTLHRHTDEDNGIASSVWLLNATMIRGDADSACEVVAASKQLPHDSIESVSDEFRAWCVDLILRCAEEAIR